MILRRTKGVATTAQVRHDSLVMDGWGAQRETARRRHALGQSASVADCAPGSRFRTDLKANGRRLAKAASSRVTALCVLVFATACGETAQTGLLRTSDQGDQSVANDAAVRDAGRITRDAMSEEPVPCADRPDDNAGPGVWRPQLRLALDFGAAVTSRPTNYFHVSKPAIAVSPVGVALAYVLADGGGTLGVMLTTSPPRPNRGAGVFLGGAGVFFEEVVDPEGFGYVSMALSGEVVYLAYLTPSGMRVAVLEGSSRRIVAVDADVPTEPSGFGWGSSIAVDASGGIHLAYGSRSGVGYATDVSGAWTSEEVLGATDLLSISEVDLAVDGAGRAHLAFIGSRADSPVLRYGVRDDGWRTEAVHLTGQLPNGMSLTLSSEETPIIVYHDNRADADLPILATYDAGAWNHELLEASLPVPGVASSSIAADGDGSLHVASIGLRSDSYSTNRSGQWASEAMSSATQFGLDHGPVDLALDDAGAAHVVTTRFLYPDDLAPVYLTNRTVEPDGIDTNCDGVDGVDADGDGHASLWTGGDDCYDADSTVWDCAGDG